MYARRIICAIAIFLLSAAAFSSGAVDGPRTGKIKLSMTPLELLGESDAQEFADILPVDETISWELYVPEGYSADDPPGVLVFISPTPRGDVPRKWRDTLDQHNLIWISANKSGNRTITVERIMLAMLAPAALDRTHALNMERCYVAGFSGGAKIANLVAAADPGRFRGGIYFGGARFWVEDAPVEVEILKQNHHVFVIGSIDPARRETLPTYRRYKEAGVENVKLIEVPNVAHRLPEAAYFDRAIDYLDSRLSP